MPMLSSLEPDGLTLKKARREVVVVPVDDDLEEIGIEVGVAPHQTGGHAAGARRVVHVGADVERVVII